MNICKRPGGMKAGYLTANMDTENCWSLQPIIWSFKVVYRYQIMHSVYFHDDNVNCQSPLVPLDPRNVTCPSSREISSNSVQVSLAM